MIQIYTLQIGNAPEVVEFSEDPLSIEENEDLSPDTIIAISPLFFEIINKKVETQKQQTIIITSINDTVTRYMSTKTQDNIKAITYFN